MAGTFIPKISYGTTPTVITFDFPPSGDTRGEELAAEVTTVETKNGTVQTLFHYAERNYKLKFSFITETKKALLETFLLTHAFYGKSFDYWFDKDDDLTKVTVALDKTSFKAKFAIITRKGAGFLYEISLVFRRTL